MNKHIFPPQDYKQCSFFFFLLRTTLVFVQFFTSILENQVPLKCNHIKAQSRETDREARPDPPREPSLVEASVESLPENQRQRKFDWQACQSSAKEWQQDKTHTHKKIKHTHTHLAILKVPWIKKKKRKANPNDPYREHQQNQKHFISHREYIIPEVTASDFST